MKKNEKQKMEALITMNLNPCCCREMDKLQSYMAQGNKINDTYLREYIYFVQFIHNNQHSDDIPVQVTDDMDGCIITRNNINQYFVACVPNCHVNKNSANRIHQALQFFYSKIQSPGGTLKVREGTEVNRVLQLQEQAHQ
jgi:hypothetical protein